MARTSYQKEEVEVFVYEETRFEFKTINHTSYQGSYNMSTSFALKFSSKIIDVDIIYPLHSLPVKSYSLDFITENVRVEIRAFYVAEK